MMCVRERAEESWKDGLRWGAVKRLEGNKLIGKLERKEVSERTHVKMSNYDT